MRSTRARRDSSMPPGYSPNSSDRMEGRVRAVFVLFGVALPSLRAQSIQVVNAAHALARRGVEVHLAYHPGQAPDPSPLGIYGLEPHPKLVLRALPRQRTPASLGFRAAAWRFARQHGAHGVFLARSKRYARWASRLGVPVVLEAHEVDSLQHADGRRFAGLERQVLGSCAGLITNCEGVRNGLAWMHDLPAVTRVIHNAWSPAPPAAPAPPAKSEGSGIAFAGSLLPTKDPHTLAAAGRQLGGITAYGTFDEPLPHGLIDGGPVQPRHLVARLRTHRTLVLPLGNGWFGTELTSPLKAFAYAMSGVPFVGADTPALHRAAPGAFEPYQPGDVQSLVMAIRRLDVPGIRAARKAAMQPRTWDDRAAEVHDVLDQAWMHHHG